MMSVEGNKAPRPALWLSYAGLLPQAAALVMLVSGNPEWHFLALALVYAYSLLILSFLGGAWWGWVHAPLCNRQFGCGWLPCFHPWWPRPSLGILGGSVLLSLGVDYRLKLAGLCPDWWITLRVALSIGLGVTTLIIACI